MAFILAGPWYGCRWKLPQITRILASLNKAGGRQGKHTMVKIRIRRKELCGEEELLPSLLLNPFCLKQNCILLKSTCWGENMGCTKVSRHRNSYSLRPVLMATLGSWECRIHIFGLNYPHGKMAMQLLCPELTSTPTEMLFMTKLTKGTEWLHLCMWFCWSDANCQVHTA